MSRPKGYYDRRIREIVRDPNAKSTRTFTSPRRSTATAPILRTRFQRRRERAARPVALRAHRRARFSHDVLERRVLGHVRREMRGGVSAYWRTPSPEGYAVERFNVRSRSSRRSTNPGGAAVSSTAVARRQYEFW